MVSIDEFIKQFQIDPELAEGMGEVVEMEVHPKGSVLLQEGEICRKFYFVLQGALRFYYYQNGKGITHWFLFEGDFITEVDSFLQQKASIYYLEAMEDCVLASLTFERVEELLVKYPGMDRFGRLAAIQILVEMGEKVKDMQFRTATDRYNRLLEKYPDILQRVSLGHIASFLGITQQSLSRIRSSQ